MFVSRVRAQEESLKASVLASLEAVDLGTSTDFQTQVDAQRRHDAIYLGQIDGRTYLLPRRIPDHVLEEAIHRLQAGDPGSEEHFTKALYRLWLLTKHEKLTDDDKEATIRLMAKSLAAFPKGLGMSALAECSLDHFFPSWAQLEKKIAERGGWRTALVFWLNRARNTLSKELP